MTASSAKTSFRVVIVDDHPNTASMLARALMQLGRPLEIVTARHAQEALDIIHLTPADILITDFMMPGMNGLELVERLTAEQLEPRLTILVTAYDSPGLSASARHLRVHHYLVKPVRPDKIRDLVGRFVDSQGALSKPAPADTAPASPPAHFKVLVADDQPDNVHLLVTRLESEGYTFVVAHDGEETLAQARAEHPDLVLLDVNMPKKSGFEVVAEMRADPELQHIPVIILTAARISPRDVREGLGLGADDYVTKPFDWRELAARLRAKLRVKHAEDTLRRRNRELSLLPEIGQDLSARMDVDELADVVLRRAVETLVAAQSFITVYQPDGALYTRAYIHRPLARWDWDAHCHWLINEGLLGQVMTAKQGALVDDVSQDARWPATDPPYTGTALCVPLLSRRGAFGTLTLIHDMPRYFVADHVGLLQAIASQAAIAIENAQLYAIERKRVNELVALNQITRTIAGFTRSSDMFDQLPALLHAMLGLPAVSLWENTPAGLTLRKLEGAENAPRQSLLQLAVEQAAATGKPAQLSGAVEERQYPRSLAGTPPSHSSLAVPLFHAGQLVGVLAVHSKHTNAFQESDRVLLETLAGQMGAAFERIRLFESVESEQKRLSAVLRAAADAILLLDAKGIVQLLNPAAQRLFTDVDTKIGRPLPNEGGYGDLSQLLAQARGTELTQREIKWPDNRTFNVLVTGIEAGGQVAILHDVTRFKELERVKTEFLASASHDLKNPLTAIMGYADLLLKFGALNDQQGEFVTRIQSASRQMLELVQDLLEMARLDMGIELKMEVLDAYDLLRSVGQEFKGQAETKGQTLHVAPLDVPVPISADPNRIRQALRNLVGNAIKYTPRGGAVFLSATPHEDTVRLQVRDTGIGIPPADQPFIFDKFYRVHSEATQDIEGSGLGLAIVKAIIEQHHGQIAVESEEARGSCFTITMPMLTLN